MPRVNGVIVARYARDAGFRGEPWVIIVAIARGESGWNTTAKNFSSIERSRGLTQINGKAHPQWDNNSMYDGAANMRAAFTLYRRRGNSFRDWSVYIHGTYRQHMADARRVVRLAGGTAVPPPPPVSEPQEPSFDFSRHIAVTATTFRNGARSLQGIAEGARRLRLQ